MFFAWACGNNVDRSTFTAASQNIAGDASSAAVVLMIHFLNFKHLKPHQHRADTFQPFSTHASAKKEEEIFTGFVGPTEPLLFDSACTASVYMSILKAIQKAIQSEGKALGRRR